jgi:hypothetical protein
MAGDIHVAALVTNHGHLMPSLLSGLYKTPGGIQVPVGRENCNFHRYSFSKPGKKPS